MGGGAMRTAAKVAGITMANSGFRGFSAERSTVARRAASVRPPAVSIAEDVKLVASQPQAALQKPCSEIEDWVFAGGEEEAVESVADPLPRVIFGGAPTLQEAKEATSELTVALEKAYLSSPESVGHEGSFPADHVVSSLSNSQVIENKACVTSELTVAPAVTTHAMKAFRLLHESSVAQTVVASIACDQNVWNAVLQNEDLQQFLKSQKTCVSQPNMKLNVDELVADSDFLDRSPRSASASYDSPDSEPGNGFMDFMQNIKSAVVDMMSSLSDYFMNLFGGSKGIFVNSDGTAKVSGDAVMEASFMGLAVMAILLILLKRA